MEQKLTDMRLAVLGTGKLGGILLRAYLKQGLFAPKNVSATVKHGEKAAALAKELGVAVTTGIEGESYASFVYRTPAQIPWLQFNANVRAQGLRTRLSPEVSYFYQGLDQRFEITR